MSTQLEDVIFVHPDLGIGGAENLVVNAALSLQKRGHRVHIYTAHHSHDHCFQATLPGQPLGNCVTVYGDWLPRSLFGGRFHVVCAILRMIYVSILVVFSLWFSKLFRRGNPRTVIFCDIVSHVVPILRCSRSPVLFYCHFPDKLLCVERQSLLKRLYRVPVDWVEEMTTGMADAVVVNSKYTATVFYNAFSALKDTKTSVLYPAIDLNEFDRKLSPDQDDEARRALAPSLVAALEDESIPVVLSVNRFERKKNLGLAVRAFAKLSSAGRLVLAGGYDPRVAENVEHMEELKDLVDELGVADRVHFVPSFTDDQKVLLLDGCQCVVYTPSNEHFGIVPIEAMYCSKPVVAVNSGGPLESILDGQTGYLCDSEPEAFAKAIGSLVKDKSKACAMGYKGREHVASKFSLEAFGSQLSSLVSSIESRNTSRVLLSFLPVVCAIMYLLARSLFELFYE